MSTQILPRGIRFFSKHDKAPDFVLGTMVITPNDLYTWLKEVPELMTEYNGAKQIKLQLLKSKEGKLYAAVDTYKAQPKDAPAQEPVDCGDLPF
jgi:hypothetical protein